MKKIIVVIMGFIWVSLWAMEPTFVRKVSLDEWQDVFE